MYNKQRMSFLLQGLKFPSYNLICQENDFVVAGPHASSCISHYRTEQHTQKVTVLPSLVSLAVIILVKKHFMPLKITIPVTNSLLYQFLMGF